jgi:hypothetical protein
MRIFNSFEEISAKVHEAHGKEGLPIDAAGVKKLLVAMRALGLVDWIEKGAGEQKPAS